jgi:hypothetical protein
VRSKKTSQNSLENHVFKAVGVGKCSIRKTTVFRMLHLSERSVHGLLPFFKETEGVCERIAFVLEVEQDDIGPRLRAGNAVFGCYSVLKSA